MNRLSVGALVAPLLLSSITGATSGLPTPGQAVPHASACKPSPTVLRALATPVPGLSAVQVHSAVTIINAALPLKVPGRGQTIAVMTALQASSLTPGAQGLFGHGAAQGNVATRSDPRASALNFYQALTRVKGWQNLPPTLAAHAAQRNLDPNAFTRWWPRANTIVNALTSGSGAAGLANLASRAQAVADCEAATLRGRFAVNGGTTYVGPLAPGELDSRALDLAKNGGNGWHDQCQHFVAVLDGRASSGFSTALDAWQTFEAQGVAHLVTSADGVAPPVGAWLYYQDSTNPAGHVVTYLGNGQIASTDVFGTGRVGVGPASAITDGPWRMQYLGWAPPWGAA